MNNREFFVLTAMVRSRQKKYFATRDKCALVESRMLESELDAEIANNIDRLTDEERERIKG